MTSTESALRLYNWSKMDVSTLTVEEVEAAHRCGFDTPVHDGKYTTFEQGAMDYAEAENHDA